MTDENETVNFLRVRDVWKNKNFDDFWKKAKEKVN